MVEVFVGYTLNLNMTLYLSLFLAPSSPLCCECVYFISYHHISFIAAANVWVVLSPQFVSFCGAICVFCCRLFWIAVLQCVVVLRITVHALYALLRRSL